MLLQSATVLLQSATGVTKCDDYYKVGQKSPVVNRFSSITTRHCQISIAASPDWDMEFDLDEFFFFFCLADVSFRRENLAALNTTQETEELKKWRSSKVKQKILNKYTLIVHRLSLSNAKTLIHVEMESTDTW